MNAGFHRRWSCALLAVGWLAAGPGRADGPGAGPASIASEAGLPETQ